jgi:hypothetical protein
MTAIANYFIAYGQGVESVEKKVKEYIAKGWQPLGGVSATSSGVYQALVLYK